jgi:hypothetical protein
VATLTVKDFPPGLLLLLEKLAAADGVRLDDLVIRLLFEQVYGFPPPAVAEPAILPLSAVRARPA